MNRNLDYGSHQLCPVLWLHRLQETKAAEFPNLTVVVLRRWVVRTGGQRLHQNFGSDFGTLDG
jgi:hypothetical protein